MEDKNYIINEVLLTKYLLKETSEEETARVQAWLSKAPENQKQYEHLLLIWEQSKHITATNNIDENVAWERFKNRVQQEEPAEERQTYKTIPLSNNRLGWLRVAAMLILIIGGGWAGYYFGWSNKNITRQINSNNEVIVAALPDGTSVTLNKKSSVTFPSSFTGHIREIILNGEAFFNVTPDKLKPFIIHTGNAVSIKVVGTSFNVKTTDSLTAVIVETGIVEVAKDKKMVKLLPEEKAIVAADSDTPQAEHNEDKLYNYYRTHAFICKETPLYKLAEVLSQAYNIPIKLSDNVRNLSITVDLKQESLDKVLCVIQKTIPVTIEHKQGTIVFR